MNILHIHHDCIMSKLDELIAIAKQLAEKPNNDCTSMITTGMICKTVVAIVGIITAALLLWYLLSLVAAKRREKRNDEREAKKQKVNIPLSVEQMREKQKVLEIDYLFELKKQYQAKALNYIEEQAKYHVLEQAENGGIKYDEKVRPSCSDDTYLKYVDKYVNQIDDRLKELIASH